MKTNTRKNMKEGTRKRVKRKRITPLKYSRKTHVTQLPKFERSSPTSLSQNEDGQNEDSSKCRSNSSSKRSLSKDYGTADNSKLHEHVSPQTGHISSDDIVSIDGSSSGDEVQTTKDHILEKVGLKGDVDRDRDEGCIGDDIENDSDSTDFYFTDNGLKCANHHSVRRDCHKGDVNEKDDSGIRDDTEKEDVRSDDLYSTSGNFKNDSDQSEGNDDPRFGENISSDADEIDDDNYLGDKCGIDKDCSGGVEEIQNDEDKGDDTMIETNLTLTNEEWSAVNPVCKDGNVPRCLQKGWHLIFDRKLEIISKECVYKYTYNRVKARNSRKSGAPFFRGTAKCKRAPCCRSATFIIEKEPFKPFEEGVKVSINLEGKQHHIDNQARRPLTGSNRSETAQKARTDGVTNVYYDNLGTADTSTIQSGNLTAIPTKDVIRKAVSEEIQKELIHKDCIQEIVLLKEAYKDDDGYPNGRYAGYIQYVAVEPFTIFLFCHEQILLLRKMRRPDLYIDATGTLIKSFPHQKRPYLYSIVVKPEANLPPVSVADMVTTDHTQPSLIHFFEFFKRAVNESSKVLYPRKVEVDWSWPLINSSMKTFNDMSVKRYLHIAWKLVQHKYPEDSIGQLTVIHICVAHMTKTFSRCARTIAGKNKELFKFLMLAFAMLSNETSLEDAKRTLNSLMTVLLSPGYSDLVQAEEAYITKRYSSYPELEHLEHEFSEPGKVDFYEEHYMYRDEITIGESSPWRTMAEGIRRSCTDKDTDTTGSNPLYSKDAVNMIIRRFIHIYPLWSGLLLGSLHRYAVGRYSEEEDATPETRDSNANVESWFSIVKKDIFTGRARMRPGSFVAKLKRSINARLKEFDLPKVGNMRKRAARGIDMAEEKWSRKKKSKKNIYQPEKRRKQDKEDLQHHDKYTCQHKLPDHKGKKTHLLTTKYPKVPSWGGESSVGQSLSNTCTVDNFLTIMHVTSVENPGWIQRFVDTNVTLDTIINCLHLMAQGNFTDAKVLWIGLAKPNMVNEMIIDAFGDEYAMFSGQINRLLTSLEHQTCSNSSCPNKESKREQFGFFPSVTRRMTIQEMFSNWLSPDNATCGESFPTTSTYKEKKKCNGKRQTQRRVFGEMPSVLAISVSEYVNSGRHPKDIKSFSEVLDIQQTRYILIGMTLHRPGHFVSCIKSTRHGWLYYDGLRGELKPFREQYVFTCVPGNLLYLREN